MRKDIPGYEGYYEVDTEGNVYSKDRYVNNRFLKGIKLSQSTLRNGYKQVGLSKEGVRKRISVHRLIAITFIPNPDNKEQVNHINGDKADNRVENLEWSTSQENNKHAYNNGLKTPLTGTKSSSAKLTEEEVMLIRRLQYKGVPRKEVYKIAMANIPNLTKSNFRVIWNFETHKELVVLD